MRILHTVDETYAAGDGIRYEIYVAGCEHQCKGCHNPQSWSFTDGKLLTPLLMNRIENEIRSNRMLDGVTISGGDPLHPDNAEGTLLLLQNLSKLVNNVWVYTGYTIEELLSAPTDYNQLYCLQYIDVLVDGPYIESLRETTGFRGSSNQRYVKAKELITNGNLTPNKDIIRKFIA